MSSYDVVSEPSKYYTQPEKINIGDLPVAYRRKGSGETVLFLHGAGFTGMWLPFYECLADEFDLIAPEHPGFGETPFPDWLRSFDDLVQHYDQFLHEMGVETCHIVGFSLGGWLAAEFASYYPRFMQSLTLINPMGMRVDWPCTDDLFAIGPEEIEKRLMNNTAEVENYFSSEVPTLEQIVHGYGEASTAARLMWTPRYNLQLEHSLKRVTCPVNIVLGDNDRLVPDAIGHRYAEVFQNSCTENIPGTGHAVFADDPQASAAAITKFIKGIAK